MNIYIHRERDREGERKREREGEKGGERKKGREVDTKIDRYKHFHWNIYIYIYIYIFCVWECRWPDEYIYIYIYTRAYEFLVFIYVYAYLRYMYVCVCVCSWTRKHVSAEVQYSKLIYTHRWFKILFVKNFQEREKRLELLRIKCVPNGAYWKVVLCRKSWPRNGAKHLLSLLCTTLVSASRKTTHTSLLVVIVFFWGHSFYVLSLFICSNPVSLSSFQIYFIAPTII